MRPLPAEQASHHGLLITDRIHDLRPGNRKQEIGREECKLNQHDSRVAEFKDRFQVRHQNIVQRSDETPHEKQCGDDGEWTRVVLRNRNWRSISRVLAYGVREAPGESMTSIILPADLASALITTRTGAPYYSGPPTWRPRTQRRGTIPAHPLPSDIPANGDVSWQLRLIHQIVEARLRDAVRRCSSPSWPGLVCFTVFFGKYQPASWLSFLEIDQPLAEQRG
jgi:hypothetical protein